MTRGDIWRTLGIDRTTDVAAIRRAYAQALRAMDPDADPEGFARLRAARDQALAVARMPEAEDEASRAAEAFPDTPPTAPVTPLGADVLSAPLVAARTAGTIDVSPPPSPSAPRPLTDARPDTGAGRSLALPPAALAAPVVALGGGDVTVVTRQATERYDAAYNALLALLHGDDEPDAEQLRETVAFLLADPRMARLAFADDAERWFADVIAGTIPRSDPVVLAVADQFGWSREAGSIALSDAAERVAERARSIDYWHAASEPSHPDHRLWAELSRPAPGTVRRGWFIRTKRMRDYLARIRRSTPDAESWFEPARVAVWDARGADGPGWSVWGIGLFILFRLLVAFFSDGVGNPDLKPPIVTTPAQTTVTSPDRDINLALLDFADGFTWQRVQRENPALARALNKRWREAATVETPLENFIRETRRDLLDRYRGALSHAPYDEAAKLRRMDLAELEAARALGADACAKWLDGDLPVERVRTREGQQKRNRVMAAIILADPRATSAKPRTLYIISGATMQRIGRETGLDRKALSAALDRRGPAKARCDARRALIGTALDLPHAAGLPLLRAM